MSTSIFLNDYDDDDDDDDVAAAVWCWSDIPVYRTSFGLYDEVHLSAQPFSTSFGGCAFVDMMNKICVV